MNKFDFNYFANKIQTRLQSCKQDYKTLKETVDALVKRVDTLEKNKTNNMNLNEKIINFISTEDAIYEIYFADETGTILSNYSKICEFNATKGITNTYANLNSLNIAPKNAKKIVAVKQDSTQVEDEVELNDSLLFPSNLGNKKYSFGALSDVHLDGDGDDQAQARNDFENALDYFTNTENVDLVCISGDITTVSEYGELAIYKEIVDTCTKPVYASRGNHDCRYSLEDWQTYTGHGLYFEVEHNSDIFLFLGMNTEAYDNNCFSSEELTWLETKLEAYKNRRVFLFFHIFMPNTCGNVKNLYPWSGLDTNASNVQKFILLMNKYKNVVYFSGHSHLEFDCQKYGANANVFDDGTTCHRVHIPSCARPRKNNTGTSSADTYYHDAGSQGYVVDVYENAIVLKGIDFIENKYLAIASYIIDTTAVEISDTEIIEYITPKTLEKMTVDGSIENASLTYDEETHKANFSGTFTQVSKEFAYSVGNWDNNFPAVGKKIRISFDNIEMQDNTDINIRVFVTNNGTSEKVYDKPVTESNSLNFEYEILDTITYVFFCVRASSESVVPNTVNVTGFKVEVV